MLQKQGAFEKTKHQQEGLIFSDISPRWATRLGERQELPVPMSNDGGLKLLILRHA
jgi:hypothetical protein